MNTTPTRLAILIAAPGPPDNYLYGPKKDLDHVSEYLQTEKAGVWYEGEIKKLFNPSVQQIKRIIRESVADYVLVYFSGHGYTDYSSDSRMICLKDGNLEDLQLLNSSRKQLVLIDACRNITGQGISGLADLEQEYSYFTGSPLREVFDNYIKNSPEGKIIVHGTQKGEYSYDSTDGSGGMFTNALLYIGTRIKAEHGKGYTRCSIQGILEHVPSLLSKQDNSQVPCIVYTSGHLIIPFALGIPKAVKPKLKVKFKPKKELVTTSNSSSNAGWALLGFSLLLIAIASSKK